MCHQSRKKIRSGFKFALLWQIISLFVSDFRISKYNIFVIINVISTNTMWNWTLLYYFHEYSDDFILTINTVNGNSSSEHAPANAVTSGSISKVDEDGWRKKCDEEAKELASSAFGGTLVGIIGEVYKEQARMKLDAFEGFHIQTKTFGRRMSSSMSVAGSGLRYPFTHISTSVSLRMNALIHLNYFIPSFMQLLQFYIKEPRMLRMR